MTGNRRHEGGVNSAMYNLLKMEKEQLERELSQAQSRVCKWTYDDDGYFMPSCGDHATSWEGGPKFIAEDGVKFCPYCGGNLVLDAILAGDAAAGDTKDAHE